MMIKTQAKIKIDTTLLTDCFGCHLSFLDIAEYLAGLLEQVELDRSLLTDLKHCNPFNFELIEGGVCNAENVLLLRCSFASKAQ